MIKTKLTALCSVIGGLCAAFFGGWDNAIKLLVCLMIADYVTGLSVALVFRKSPHSKTGGPESKAGFKGLCRKGAIMCIVLIAYRLELVTGITYIREAVIYGFGANEMISLVENVGLMGVPVPKVVNKAIDLLKDKRDGKNE